MYLLLRDSKEVNTEPEVIFSTADKVSLLNKVKLESQLYGSDGLSVAVIISRHVDIKVELKLHETPVNNAVLDIKELQEFCKKKEDN